MRYVFTGIFLTVGSAISVAGQEVSGVEIPGWTTILPPLVAIALALILKEVLISLTFGIFTGLILVSIKNSETVWDAFLNIPLVIQDALFDNEHLAVILFTLMIGAMVSIISQNGGMMALVKRIARRANTARSGQLATWLLGIAIFFDDYANTLIVGNTMRPLTDRLKVSREKLAYIVDSTAAPVAAIAFITTWIGAELGFINDGIAEIENGASIFGSAYAVFFQSLQYMFYPILTLFFVFLIIWKRKDFGPMVKAEQHARNAETNVAQEAVGDIDEIEDRREHIWSGLVPIVVMIAGAATGMIFTGMEQYTWVEGESLWTNISGIIGEADSYKALIWGSFGGLVSAILITIVPRLMTVKKTMEMAEKGVKSMMPAILILTLAWALGGLTKTLGTATYLSTLLSGEMPPQILPTVVFIFSGLIAFSTGTSWGTMTILYPLVLSLSWKLCMETGLSPEYSMAIFANVTSAVLAGSVLGDHCSPISDTTILSSLSTDCDHVAHVRTQLPYALTVGGVSTLLGTLPAGYGIPFYVTFPTAAACLYFIVSYFGKMGDKEALS